MSPQAVSPQQELLLVDHLPYESATEFIRLYGHLVTAGGFLLRHKEHATEGRPVSFDLRLVDDRPMLQGRGLVRWCRTDVDGGAVLGIKFTSLEPESQRVLDLLKVTRGAAGRTDEPPPPPQELASAKPRPAKDFPRIAPVVPAMTPLVRPPAVVPVVAPVKTPGEVAPRVAPVVPPLGRGAGPVSPPTREQARRSTPPAIPAVGAPAPEATDGFTYSPASDPKSLDETAARTGLIGLPPNLKRAAAPAAMKKSGRSPSAAAPRLASSLEEGFDLQLEAVVGPQTSAPGPAQMESARTRGPRTSSGTASASLEREAIHSLEAAVIELSELEREPAIPAEPNPGLDLSRAPGDILPASSSGLPPELSLGDDELDRAFSAAEHGSAQVATAAPVPPAAETPRMAVPLPAPAAAASEVASVASAQARSTPGPTLVPTATARSTPEPAPASAAQPRWTPEPVPVTAVPPRAAEAAPVPTTPTSRQPAPEQGRRTEASRQAAGSTPGSMEVTPRDAARSGLEALRISRAIEALRRKEFDKAEAQLQQAIAEDPQNGRLRFELGLVYFEWSDARTRDHDGAAEASFARAAELDPTSDQPLVYLGQVQLRRRLWADAHRSFAEALQRNPHARGATEGLEILQGLKVRQTLTRGAMATAALLLVAGPLIWFGLGSSASPASAATSELAVSATPAPQVVAAAAAPAAQVIPAPVVAPVAPPVVAAAPPPRVAADPAPTPPETRSVERDAAPARARRAAPRQPKAASASGGNASGGNASALVRQGDSALRSGKVDEALQHFNKALAVNARYAPAHRGLGSVYVMQGKDEEAIASYRKYLSLAPNASDVARIRALVSGME